MITEKSRITRPSAAFPYPTLPVDYHALAAYLEACQSRHIGYGLGAKADSDGHALAEFPPRYAQIDCSGFVRAALAYSSGVAIPDGSVVQHAWFQSRGFKASDRLSLLRIDGILRIAFIRPTRLRKIGHVYLCRNRATLESWGGHGPGSRSPLAHALRAGATDVYAVGV